MGTATPWTTMPRRPSNVLVDGVLELDTLLQHCTEPVLHSETVVSVAVAVTVTVVVAAGVVVGDPQGVAAARRGSAKSAMKVVEKCIGSCEVVVEDWKCFDDWRFYVERCGLLYAFEKQCE